MKKVFSRRKFSLYNTKVKYPKRTYNTVGTNWQKLYADLSPRDAEREIVRLAELEDLKAIKIINATNCVDLNAVVDGESALTASARHSSHRVARWLQIQENVDVNILDDKGLSAGHIYAGKGNQNEMLYWINHGGNINLRGQYKETPIFQAVINNQFEMVDFLHRKGAQFGMKNREGKTVLIVASENAKRFECFKTILNCGADINVQDKYGKTALMCAICNNNTAALDMLMSKKYINYLDINLPDANGATALMHAAKCGRTDIIRRLISLGADVLAVDYDGNNAANYALRRRNKRRSNGWQGSLQIIEAEIRKLYRKEGLEYYSILEDNKSAPQPLQEVLAY